jgi:hypothetical protein
MYLTFCGVDTSASDTGRGCTGAFLVILFIYLTNLMFWSQMYLHSVFAVHMYLAFWVLCVGGLCFVIQTSRCISPPALPPCQTQQKQCMYFSVSMYSDRGLGHDPRC